VEHLSNNQTIGFIDIGRDHNPDLMDQTNREGLIHNPAFEDLRRLVYFVLQAVEAERQSIRHPPRRFQAAVGALQGGADSIAAEIRQLAARVGGKVGKELGGMHDRLRERVAREAAELRRTVEGYAGLAAIGQTATGLAPVIPAEMRRIEEEIRRLREVLARRRVPEAREALAGLEQSLGRLGDCHRLMLTAAVGGERRRAIDVVAEVSRFRDVIAPLLQGRGVAMEIHSRDAGVLRTDMRPENFLCLLHILAANALDWLGGVPSPRLRVSLAAWEEDIEIIFSDNGPGVPAPIAHLIFNPLFTRKESGRGMGLAVARQLVESHGGYINLMADGRRRGANFQIVLPRKRSRATIYDGQ
jgi:C4-dicarboxylate-specific signal transduction histidine kinase